MEATYCMGSDVDVCRMFDQYLYKRNENLDLSLSVPHGYHGTYNMGDQTFHTPSFGDEEFDIPPINPHHHQQQQQQQQSMSYQAPQMLQTQASDSLNMNSSAYQQPLYLSGPGEHPMAHGTPGGYNGPQQVYSMSSPGQPGPQLLLLQQQHQQQQQQQQQHGQMMLQHGGQHAQPGVFHGRSPQGNSPPTGQEATTTSEDSDDSTPHAAMMAGMKRPSPEPADVGVAKVQKKPKTQKKKKKRDPNEPQKPVSAYALFFRDTQAAIKGQNPNASFGEVSKIVASMWDALDAEHKNVYKKKTEAAKKEYLKALAAYRASLVSKGAGDAEGMYGSYGGYGGGYNGYSPPTTVASPPILSQQQITAMAKKTPLLTTMMAERANGQAQQQQAMMNSPIGQGVHMAPPHPGSYMQGPQGPSPAHHMSPPRGGMVSSPPPTSGPPQQPGHHRLGAGCIRHGCPNAAVVNSEWEDEYCSNECVVSHCRDVFSSWVASNQNQTQNFSAVK